MTPKQLMAILNLVIFGAALYIIGSSIYVAQTTGLLKVTSANKDAIITVSQADHEAKILGKGKGSAHLKPGIYQVAATTAAGRQFSTVTITKKQTTSSVLNPTSPPRVPSVESIDFKNINALVNSGLSNTQVSLLKQDFFDFKHSASTVLINPGTIAPGPRNPNVDIAFKLNFTVSIDNVPYKATASHAGLTDLRLYLYDNSGKLLFDSGPSS